MFSLSQYKGNNKKKNNSDAYFTAGTGYGGNASADDKKLRQGREKALQKELTQEKKTTKYLTSILTSLQKSSSLLPDDTDTSKIKLVKVLQEVFHNTNLTDWAQRQELYTKALNVCQALADFPQHDTMTTMITPSYSSSDLAELLYMPLKDDDKNLQENSYYHIEIYESSEETILTCLERFATLAECVVDQNKQQQQKKKTTASAHDRKTKNKVVVDAQDIALAQHILKVYQAVKARVQQLQNRQRNHNKRATAAILSVTTPQDLYQQQLSDLRFSLCPKLSGHYFLQKTKNSSSHSSPQLARNLFKEMTSYKATLPCDYASSIFCRALEDRMDLLRVMIMGPDDTPYANGAYVFDVNIPSAYPQTAPKVQFVNHGSKCFNPNLYNNGKVCLSLLGTWKGPGWVAGTSTLLQVLISIQALILVQEPYFNEPGYERELGTPSGTRKSEQYNQQIRKYTLQVSMEPFLETLAGAAGGGATKSLDYPEFHDVLRRHYRTKRACIINQWQQWASQDTSLVPIVARLRGLLDQVAPPAPSASRKRPPPPPPPPAISYNVDANGVIDLLSEEQQPYYKRRKCCTKPTDDKNNVVVLDVDNETDDIIPTVTCTTSETMRAATAGGAALSLSSFSADDVVDLT